MTKRANNEGSIWRRKDGRWCAAYFVPKPGGRGRVRKYVYGKTRAEVHQKLTEVMRHVQQGIPVPVSSLTVREYLETWLQEVAAHRVRPKTLEGYTNNVRRHIVPRIGKQRLGALTARDVRQMLDRLCREGRSARLVQAVHATLRTALEHAVREEEIPRNVARLVSVPTPPRSHREPLTIEQGRLLLKVARDDRLYALYVVSLVLGLRRGEALGLRWRDINLDSGVLSVRQTVQRVNGALVFAAPKTFRSRRAVPLPDVCLAALRAHRQTQAQERDASPVAWPQTELVFTTRFGTPIEPRNYSRSFRALCERAGVPALRLHDLRHSCVSLLLALGVPPRVVMEIVGHSGLEMTMNVYGHVSLEAQREALRRFGGLLE